MQAYSDDEHGLPSKKGRKSGKARRKRSRDDIDSGDEEVAGAGYESKRPREAAKTAEQLRQEQMDRETAREEAKAILKSIMLLSSGLFISQSTSTSWLKCSESSKRRSMKSRQAARRNK